MLKINVATYLINNINNRFPIRNDTEVDSELIAAVVDRWAAKKYLPIHSHSPFNDENSLRSRRYLQ